MNLHDQILAEIERRETIVGPVHAVAPPGTWGTHIDNGKLYVIDSDGDPLALIPHRADAAHVVLHDPADALRRYAGYRMLLSIAGVMEEQAKLKQQSADRFGDPKDNQDMSGPDRIAWLIQSDMALTYAEHARQITATVARALNIEVPS